MDSRPRALVTAPVRGPGLELLHELADLVIDPWIDQQPIRIYNADQLAERADAEGATILIVEADSCKGVVFEQPLLAVASTRGDPTNVDVAAATAAGVPVLRAPARNADAVAELAVALLLAVNRGVVRADARCAHRARPTGTGPSPTSGSGPGSWPDARPGSWGSGRGSGLELATRRPRHARRVERPLRARCHPQPRRAPRDLRRRVHARAGHARDHRHDRQGPVRRHARRRHLPEHGAGPAPRRRRPGGGAAVGQGRWRRPRPLRRGASGHRRPAHHLRQRRPRPAHRWCHLRHRGQRHTRSSPRISCRLRAGVTPRHIVNPEVLGRSRAARRPPRP